MGLTEVLIVQTEHNKVQTKKQQDLIFFEYGLQQDWLIRYYAAENDTIIFGKKNQSHT